MISKQKNNIIIFGLCKNISKKYKIPASVIRLFFLIFASYYGVGIIFYLAIFQIWASFDEKTKQFSAEKFNKNLNCIIERSKELGKIIFSLFFDFLRGIVQKDNQNIGIILIWFSIFILLYGMGIIFNFLILIGVFLLFTGIILYKQND